MSFGSHHRNFSIEYTLMFIFLWNCGSIGIHSYEPSGSKAIKMISCLFSFEMWSRWIYAYEPIGSKGKNPIKILSYRVPMIFLHTKGWLKLLQVIRRSLFVHSSPIFIVTSRRWMKWYILGILYVCFGIWKLGKSLRGLNFQ